MKHMSDSVLQCVEFSNDDLFLAIVVLYVWVWNFSSILLYNILTTRTLN